MGGTAPGDGESLRGAAAPSTNRKVQRSGADQSGVKGRGPGWAQPWRLEFGPRAAAGEAVCVSRVAVTAVTSRDLDRDGYKARSRQYRVASLHVDGPV